MVERISHRYLRLFEVRLLHHYWLNEGEVLFDELPDELKRRRLLTYDARSFLSVEPTSDTAALLAGLKAVFKPTGLGKTLWARLLA
jgi:hypothetical protein